MTIVFCWHLGRVGSGIGRWCDALVDGLPADQLAPTGPRVVREVRAWWALVRHHRHGLVVAGVWYPEGLLAVLAGCERIVVLAHGSEIPPSRARWRRGTWTWLMRQVFRRATVVANSRYIADLIARRAPGIAAHVVPLGVDLERFSPGPYQHGRASWSIPADDFVILTVGRLVRIKNHRMVLDAIKLLPAELRARTTYVIAGEGPCRKEINDHAWDLDLVHRVRFLGLVDVDLPDVYRMADLFVLPTIEIEGFGLVFLEAQACGVPAIGSRTGGIPETGCLTFDLHDGAAGLAELIVLTERVSPSVGAEAVNRTRRTCGWCRHFDLLRSVLADHDQVLSRITAAGEVK